MAATPHSAEPLLPDRNTFSAILVTGQEWFELTWGRDLLLWAGLVQHCSLLYAQVAVVTGRGLVACRYRSKGKLTWIVTSPTACSFIPQRTAEALLLACIWQLHPRMLASNLQLYVGSNRLCSEAGYLDYVRNRWSVPVSQLESESAALPAAVPGTAPLRRSAVKPASLACLHPSKQMASSFSWTTRIAAEPLLLSPAERCCPTSPPPSSGPSWRPTRAAGF